MLNLTIISWTKAIVHCITQHCSVKKDLLDPYSSVSKTRQEVSKLSTIALLQSDWTGTKQDSPNKEP